MLRYVRASILMWYVKLTLRNITLEILIIVIDNLESIVYSKFAISFRIIKFLILICNVNSDIFFLINLKTLLFSCP